MDFLKSEKLAESHKNWASEIVLCLLCLDEPRKNDSHAFDGEYNSRKLKKNKSITIIKYLPTFLKNLFVHVCTKRANLI